MNNTTKTAVDAAATDVRKDAENDAKHGLSHIEQDFTEWFDDGERDAGEILRFIATKLGLEKAATPTPEPTAAPTPAPTGAQ